MEEGIRVGLYVVSEFGDQKAVVTKIRDTFMTATYLPCLLSALF
jgi:hypothetical protein